VTPRIVHFMSANNVQQLKQGICSQTRCKKILQKHFVNKLPPLPAVRYNINSCTRHPSRQHFRAQPPDYSNKNVTDTSKTNSKLILRTEISIQSTIRVGRRIKFKLKISYLNCIQYTRSPQRKLCKNATEI